MILFRSALTRDRARGLQKLNRTFLRKTLFQIFNGLAFRGMAAPMPMALTDSELLGATLHAHVRFSNRPVWVKRFQTVHRRSVDVAHGLVLLFGIGTRALVWGFLSQAA
jgi:hypothetical protein